mgnify:CR=1 FL=1
MDALIDVETLAALAEVDEAAMPSTCRSFQVSGALPTRGRRPSARKTRFLPELSSWRM